METTHSKADQWFTPAGITAIAATLAIIGGTALYFRYRNSGGAFQLGQDVANGLLDAVAGVASAPINGISRVVGIGEAGNVTDNVDTVRTMIANQGAIYASKWSTAGAFLQAMLKGPLEDYGREGKVRAIGPAAIERVVSEQ